MKKKFIAFILSLITVIFLGVFISQSDVYEYPLDENTNEITVDKINVEEKIDLDKPPRLEEIIKNPKIETVTISAAGDLMLHMPVVNSVRDLETGEYNFDEIFPYIKNINEESDFSIVNLETIIREDREFSGYPLFNSPKEIIPSIKNAGFDIVGLANNHTYDQGKEGVLNTINLIENEKLQYVGSNKDKDVSRTRVLEKGNIKLGLMAYTYGLNGHIPEDKELINVIDTGKIKEDIKELKNEDVDKIILFVHWGVEYNSKVYEELRNFGHELLDLGIDYILGSHPHVIMPVEKVGDEKFIVYSMGNFISNQRQDYLNIKGVEDGLMIRFTLKKIDEDTTLDELEIIPTWVNRYRDNKWNYKILPIEKTLNGDFFPVDEQLENKLRQSLNRTEEILNN